MLKKMKLSGWIYDNNVCPWIKVFDVDLRQNQRFSNVPYDEIIKHMLDCDLNGFYKNAFHNCRICNFFDFLFEMCGVNLKNGSSEKQYIKLDGINKFKSTLYHFLSTEHISGEIDDKPIDMLINKYDMNDSSAMFTLINDKYMYFNMTSYDFWKPKYDLISKTFNSANLGGWLIDITQYPKIHSLFPKEIFNYDEMNKLVKEYQDKI